MYLVAARILEWTHLSPHPTPGAHLDEDLVLPLATAIHEKGPSFQSHQRFPSVSLAVVRSLAWLMSPMFLQAHVPIIFVILLLPLSTALVLFALTTLPITVSWPHTITDLAQLGRELHGYSQSGPAQMAHVIGVMAISAIWKHAWSIPGSVVWVRTPLRSDPYFCLLANTIHRMYWEAPYFRRHWLPYCWRHSQQLVLRVQRSWRCPWGPSLRVSSQKPSSSRAMHSRAIQTHPPYLLGLKRKANPGPLPGFVSLCCA